MYNVDINNNHRNYHIYAKANFVLFADNNVFQYIENNG